MQKQKTISILIIVMVIVFVLPIVASAAWWNPFSWGFWNYFFHKTTIQTPVACPMIAKLCPDGSSVSPKGPKCEFPACPTTIGITTDSLKNVTLSYPNPYDEAKNDTINLVNGHAIIYDAGNIKPRGYTIAATAIGDLNGDGTAEGVIGLYQGWGANRITPIIFIVSDKNGTMTQIDSVLPDPSVWNDETQIKSLSIENGILSVNLLVLSDADKNLPHYQQQATVAKTVQYKLVNGKLVLQTTDQTAGCLNSGGKVETTTCYCSGTKDFYNNCLIGACTCTPNPAYARKIKNCDCGQGKCFDGEGCISR